MKILNRSINFKTMEGSVKLEAEEEDEMYHLYNIIAAGDIVEASTVRNVVLENKAGAKADKKRMHIKVAIKVEKIEFDSEQGSLRLNGANCRESEYLKLGQYHTIEVALHRSLTIEKEHWDSLYLGT